MLAIYTRLSQIDDESHSISNQKREGKAFAKKQKLSCRIYDEGMGVSGKNEIEERPALDKLMKDISSKEITHVWFRNQNRLERNSMTFHIFANLVKKNNVKVYFNDKLEDWSNPNSFLQSSILTALNEYQASLQSYQTKKALLDNVKEGKSFGIYPYGYKSEKGFLVIDEDDEAEIVRMIYKLSLEGMGTRSIAELLNKENIPTRYNKIGSGKLTVKNKYTGKARTIQKKDIKWSGNSVRGIIVNQIYKGKRKWGKEYFDAPAIFDEDYWQKVNDNLKNNANNTGKKVVHKYLLKGVLRCGKCGRNMYGRSRVNKKDHYYQCSSKRIKGGNCGNRSINIDKIEGVVWSRFFKGNDLLDLIKKDIVKEDDQIQELKELVETYTDTVSSLQNEKEKLIALAAKGIFTEEEIIKQKKSLDNKIKENKKLIADYKKQVSNAENSQNLIDDYMEEFESYSEILSFLEKQKIVNKYIKEIEVFSSTKIIQNYYLIFKFNLNVEDEHYFFNTKHSILVSKNDETFSTSKYFNPNSKEPYSETKLELLDDLIYIKDEKIISLPFFIDKDGMAKFIHNTIAPHGNIADWNINKMVRFYNKNPKWFCQKSGLSVLSIDESLEGYKVISKEYKKFSKSNSSIRDWLTLFLKSHAFSKKRNLS